MLKIPSDLRPLEAFAGADDAAAAAAAAFLSYFFSMLVITVAIIAWLESGLDAPVSY